MWRGSGLRVIVLAIAAALSCLAQDPLPSWNEGRAKKAILDFVARTTRPESADFVPPAERIAVFDNDGTLWVEQPIYAQFAFAMDRLRALAPRHPEWREQQPFRAALSGNLAAFAATGERGVLDIVMATHAGITTDAFEKTVKDWIGSAHHPRFQRLYTECVYQPMLEVLAHFRRNGYKTYVVSGGGVEFMRAWTEPVYGIPPEQVIGSSVKLRFDFRGGQPVLKRLPEVNFVDDKAGKPVGIQTQIGRRPVAAFGNSDGDLQMLEWTAAGKGPRLMLLVHHTDAVREYAYDRQSAVGRLDQALDTANLKGWIVVDMKRDWKTIFPWAPGL